jgi:hypothetical protein
MTSSNAQSPEEPSIFPPDSRPYGLSYEDHIKNYWKWFLANPAEGGPVEDNTGEKCALGQKDTNPVFYLVGSGGGSKSRTCTIPAGKGLLIPTIVVEVSDKEIPGASVETLQEIAIDDQNKVNTLTLKIGDKVYGKEDLDRYRTLTDPFDVVFADNGHFGVVKGGPAKVVADGRYIITGPLSKGTYNIEFKGIVGCLDPPICTRTTFAQDVKYTLIVK